MTYDKKFIGPVVSFIIWLSLFAVICIIGISNVFAQVIDYRFMNTTVENNFSVGANSSLSANTYINVTGDSTRKYLVVDLCSTVGSGFSTEVTSNFDGSNTSFYKMYDLGESCTTKAGYLGAIIRTYYLVKNWSDSGNGNQAINNTTKFNNALSYSGIFELISVSLSDNVDTSDLSLNNQNIIINEIGSLNNSITNTEQNITNSITDSENNINSNIDDMEQSIVNSNKETQEVIKDQFNTCRDSYNLFSYSLFNMNQTYGLIELDNSKSYVLSVKLKEGQTIPSGLYFGFTDKSFSGSADPPHRIDILSNGKFIGRPNSDGWYVGKIDSNSIYKYVFVFPKDINVEQYFYINLNEGSVLKPYEPYGKKICTNKLDEQNETSKGIFGKIKDLFNWLTNDDEADVSSAGDTAGWLPAGPIDSIITLPLTMLNNINSSLKKTCSPLNVNLPYVNKSVEIPCLSTIFNQITGLNSFWTWVGLITSVLILYRYLINLYKYYDRLTTLQANFISDWGSI